ncbi:MAG TPA: hypothetical protein VFM61_04040 [Pseudidiomarina sp.]|nr:hypothetical protein [Pseudidiomarina sp.]
MHTASSPIISAQHWHTALRALGRYWLLVPLLLGLLLATAKWWSTEHYEAYTVVVPKDNQQGGLADMLGGLGGLSSLAGINLGSSGVDNTQFAIESLRSRQFLFQLIEQYQWQPLLLAVTGWDAESGITIDPDFNAEQANIWDAYEVLNDRFSVNPDAATGTITLTLNHESPDIAAQWLEIIVTEINRVMRQREQQQISQRIEYLSNQVQQTEIAQIETALYNLLQEQYKQQMLIAVNEDHIFETVDPPFVPQEPAGLSAWLWLWIGILLGGLMMGTWTFSRAYRAAQLNSQ